MNWINTLVVLLIIPRFDVKHPIIVPEASFIFYQLWEFLPDV